MNQLVILAGGMGTRLRERLGDLPKPMIPIGGKPLLEHQLELAKAHGFDDVLIFACHRADVIEQHFGDGGRWDLRVRTIVEREPLGTAGALLAGFDLLADEFVVLYGDTMVNVDLQRISQTHARHQADATLLVHPNDHPLDSDLLETDGDGWVTAFHNRPHPAGRWFQNLVNAGLYVVRKSALQLWLTPLKPMDFGKDLFPAMLRRGGKLLAYNSPEYIKDIGTPERYDKICAEYAAGVVQRSSLHTPQRAVFLDRDGTLAKEVDGLKSPDQLELLPDVAAAIRELNHHGWRAIVVTNQPVVAKGFCTEADVAVVHNKMETLLGMEHAFLDRIYWCPHHPEKGFPGERPELKIDCDCRKPKPGMLRRAARDFNLDLAACWLIGDTTTDLETGRVAGVKTVLVRTGHGGCDGKFKAEPVLHRGQLAGRSAAGYDKNTIMIISRTPLRMSFVGGGSDLPVFYRRFGGAVVSTAINQFIYVTINKKFDDRIRVSYSRTEDARSVDRVKHPLVREAMKLIGISGGIEITSIADIPAKGTGLGSSSSFTVGLLNALHAYAERHAGAEQLAREASEIEIVRCGEPIGRQDQYAAAFGGLNFFQFNHDDSVSVEPIICKRQTLEQLQAHTLVFFTGITRSASGILQHQQTAMASEKKKQKVMQQMVELAWQMRRDLQQNRVEAFGEIIHEGWLLKKSLTPGITTDIIDRWYARARKAGATGGKLLGAGTGGFLMFHAPPERHEAITRALTGLRRMDFSFEQQGSRIIFVHQ